MEKEEATEAESFSQKKPQNSLGLLSQEKTRKQKFIVKGEGDRELFSPSMMGDLC